MLHRVDKLKLERSTVSERIVVLTARNETLEKSNRYESNVVIDNILLHGITSIKLFFLKNDGLGFTVFVDRELQDELGKAHATISALQTEMAELKMKGYSDGPATNAKELETLTEQLFLVEAKYSHFINRRFALFHFNSRVRWFIHS